STTSKPKSTSSSKPAVSKKATGHKEKGKDKDKDKAPPASASPQVVTARLSAARLASELAAKSEETKRKYEGKTLELSGLFDKVQTTSPPAGVFLVQGPFLCCNLGGVSTNALRDWLALVHAKPFTVRGVFERDGQLHNCELRPLAAPADERYKGKLMEVSGFV